METRSPAKCMPGIWQHFGMVHNMRVMTCTSCDDRKYSGNRLCNAAGVPRARC